jgi:adenylate cyclase class 2
MHDNMIEVEVKAKIESFEEIEEKLSQLGAVKTKKEFQEDIYFNSPIVDFAQTDEALRIRTTKEDEDTKIFITYKGPKIDKSSKTRKEIEMEIEDSEKCADIFKQIGFKQVRAVRKNRQYYTYKNFEISLDDVEGLEPYMEIEIGLEDGEDYSEAQNKIFELFEKLGITEGFERTSYLELLENLYNI